LAIKQFNDYTCLNIISRFKIRNQNTNSEAELLDEFHKTGDLGVLGKLYEPYMYLIFGLCLKYLKDTAKSEDAVMQIFESLIKKLRVHKVENFKSWLYTVARNHCLMQLRSESKSIEISFDETFMENDQLVHHDVSLDEKEEKLQRMEECIERLNEEQRICIRLFFLEEKCYKDITEITSFSLGQVKSYIQNGKRNLKNCMDRNI